MVAFEKTGTFDSFGNEILIRIPPDSA